MCKFYKQEVLPEVGDVMKVCSKLGYMIFKKILCSSGTGWDIEANVHRCEKFSENMSKCPW